MKKIEFKIIKDDSYSEEINKILDEEEMDSLINIKYLKVPNLFDSLKMDSVETPIIVVGIDIEKNTLVGVGACSIFENKIGYLNSFRIKKEYRNKVKFNEAYKKIIEEVKKYGIETIITTILSENKIAQKILTKKRKNMPIYEFYRNINFYSIKNKNKGNLKVYDKETLKFEDSSIILKNKENKIYIAKEYKKIYRFIYFMRKIISFFGYPELPKKNEKLNFLYLEIENEKNLKKTINFLQNKGIDCNFFMLGVYENSEIDKKMKNIKSFKYSSKLYKVFYEKQYKETEINFKFWDL